jgi:RNA polymerase subunit RPABC4/transcription elongation factor Spt4
MCNEFIYECHFCGALLPYMTEYCAVCGEKQ